MTPPGGVGPGTVGISPLSSLSFVRVQDQVGRSANANVSGPFVMGLTPAQRAQAMDALMKSLKERLFSGAASKRGLSTSANGRNKASAEANGGTQSNGRKPSAGGDGSSASATRSKVDSAQVLQALASADAQHALKHTPQPGGEKSGR